jgi:hypothetical protein
MKNGGPACELCEFSKDENGNDTVICKHCPDGYLTKDGKCFRCQDELESGCKNCTIKENEINKTEKLVCTNCQEDYILSKNGHCIHFNSFVQRIPFCYNQVNFLEKYINNLYDFNDTNDINDTNINNTNYINYEYRINSVCKTCKDGYIHMDNSCYSLNISNCSLISLLLPNYKENLDNYTYNYEDKLIDYNRCNELCEGSKYVKINYFYEITEIVKIYYENNNT